MAVIRAGSTSASSGISTLAAAVVPTEGSDTLLISGDVTVDGLGGNDSMLGGSGNQVLIGSNGNDTLESTAGNDTLIGGADDDLYVMGDYADHNVIINIDANPNKNDVLYLKEVNETELTGFQRIGNDIIIRWGTNSQVTLKDVYLGEDHQITTLRLQKFLSTYEEVSYTMREVFERYTYLLTDGDDVLGPSDLNEHVRGGNGNDKIDMGAGNDYLSGDAGDDTLDGGTGNDTMYGGLGNDVFVLRKGSGIDSITSADNTAGRVDMIRFEDIPSTDLTAVVRSGWSLVLKYGDADEVTIVNYFSTTNNVITHVSFSDGQIWDMAQLFAAYPIQLGAGDDEATSFPQNLNETIKAGAGNDTIGASGGNDAVYGEDGNDSLAGDAGTDTIYGGDGTDNINGGIDNDTLYGDAGNDTIDGGTGDDVAYGGTGNDTLNGSAGNDTLDGGTGNDSMIGGGGNDVFILRVGSGIDQISLADTGANKVDVIRFEDVASTALTGVSRSFANLTLTYGNGDSVTLTSYYTDATTKFSTIQFSDGVSFRADQLFANYAIQLGDTGDNLTFTDDVETIRGGAGNDTITAAGGNDLIDGQADNDNLNGGLGNDTVFGGAGNDTMYGLDGDDVMDGGVGDDSINTGVGNDTVLLRIGSGQDSVNFAGGSVDRVKTLVFEDVAFNALTGAARSGWDLILTYGTSDKVTLVNYFSGTSYEVQKVVFTDGTHTVQDILAGYALKLTTGDDDVAFTRNWAETIYADGGNDKVDAAGGDDIVNGGAGNDSILGGLGNDTLAGDEGRDTLDGGAGDDRLSGGLDNDSLPGGIGNDTLDGGAGNDTMTGGTGNDVYLLRVGSGIDTINLDDTSTVKTKIIRFEDVASDDLTAVKRVGANLVMEYGNGDSVNVTSYFGANKFNALEFSDGVSFTPAQLFAKYEIQLTTGADSGTYSDDAETIHGGAGNDSMLALGGNDALYGEADNDTLNGGLGNDSLYGGDGTDILIGDAGDDRFDGGAGADNMTSGAGNDTFVFRRGSGADTVSVQDSTAGRIKTFIFEDVASTDITGMQRSASNLIITYGNGDQITVQNHFSGITNEVNSLVFTDKTVTVQDLLAVNVLKLTSGVDNLTFPRNMDETIYADAGADVVDAGGGNDAVYGEAGADSLTGGAGNDTLSGGTENDTLLGGNDNDVLSGDVGRDSLSGDAGDDYLSGGLDIDTLLGGAGNDTLDGGAGNDSLKGGTGNDLYLLRIGSGIDTIDLEDTSTLKNKVIRFEDVASDQLLAVKRVGTNLVIDYGTGDSVTVSSFYGANKFNAIEFSDGSFTQDQLFAKYEVKMADTAENATFTDSGETIHGGAGNDTITAAGGDDVVYGEADNDNVYGGNGNDTLFGGAGNDNLNGDAGDDWVAGGIGNDTITANSGNDTIVFHSGDGIDLLNISDATVGRLKTVVFEDIGALNMTSLQRVGGNLVVTYTAGDQVTISNYLGAPAAINTLKFADGDWTMQDLFDHYNINLSTAADTLVFSAWNESVLAGAGNDSLDGAAGNDRLFGELGNDTLTGGAGNDTLSGGVGTDSLTGGAGDDVYVFQLGSGIDTVNAYDATAGRFESLVFEDVALSQVRSVAKVSNNLVIAYGTSDQVTVTGQFASALYAVNAVQFSDGANHTVAELIGMFSGT
ncbi:hemolysin type calcium-binding protein [Pseudoduganella flava]|uniref:Hemolysin type calcium-binding protein n=1 Tax=Pseudoduganella flava TaxID=871742 RepID=A0A562PSQ3_9BURK|nr:calcium-binding protein [Pseudoduganella flava]QGZ39228.1 hypothetical protein GO485_09345 [Pseudoduganella flava]TWI47474.1 hemolysin type calcium-binding protein [Pseudoduganella flava]